VAYGHPPAVAQDGQFPDFEPRRLGRWVVGWLRIVFRVSCGVNTFADRIYLRVSASTRFRVGAFEHQVEKVFRRSLRCQALSCDFARPQDGDAIAVRHYFPEFMSDEDYGHAFRYERVNQGVE